MNTIEIKSTGKGQPLQLAKNGRLVKSKFGTFQIEQTEFKDVEQLKRALKNEPYILYNHSVFRTERLLNQPEGILETLSNFDRVNILI